ncbi:MULTISPECIES: hypothetical protein [Asticcacaulis]|uniref:hypothetical protein n=1 Tax=Asticcacaulis TaxID=76890 RepID=UPI001AE2D425|nr:MULTISPECIES: hypothetical protein [Asticcacaulis]MBP2158095.1 hypothetical protein [Asticcacaulis solisilvae]MDR6799140.1 hypothetical protein [Asticcacaulis sp. BE141]
MKLIIREYLASLRERDELDAILPDLLSEMGFTIISKPARGTKQHGVDIAAVGYNEAGEKCVYLFSVKKGDLTRQDWNVGNQALRPSLDEIQDVYIPSSIPVEYVGLKIIICLCFGGYVKETIRADVSGYQKKRTTDDLSFEEWNGDKIAGLISEGILREEMLPKDLRSHFQKSVALVDEPDISYKHFSSLVTQLRQIGGEESKRVRSARQIYICVWILFVWARDAENVDSAYRACELAILNVWELVKPLIENGGSDNEEITKVLFQLVQLYQVIGAELIGKRILPYSNKRHSLSVATHSHSRIDVNLKLFDMLGRLAMMGLIHHWLNEHLEINSPTHIQGLTSLVGSAFDIIENNPALYLPCHDAQATSIALFLLLCLASGAHQERCEKWLVQTSARLNYSVLTQVDYPTISIEYEDLLIHPRRDEGYFKEATAGSTLIPLLACWLNALGHFDVVASMEKMVGEKLDHTTMQLWTADASSEVHMYVNSDEHGLGLCDLPIKPGTTLAAVISELCGTDKGFESLSANKTGFWPIILMACRHWELPVPPNFWLEFSLFTNKD